MKKIILGLLMFATILSFGQIKTTKISPKVDLNASKPYDSLSIFLGENVSKYIGQELYLKGKHKDLKKFGYSDFYTTNVASGLRNDFYKCCSESSKFNSNYKDLAEKYFEVLDVTKQYPENEMSYYKSKYYLKLKEKSSNDIVYYVYDSDYESSFPFIVVGFFEKLKKNVIGKKFVFGSTDSRFGEEELDVKTGKSIVFKLGEKWECIDLTIDEEHYNLSMILKDKIGQNLAVNYEFIVGPKKLYDVFTSKEAEKYELKFGSENWKTLLQGKVMIGMTKEMCKLSWGEPNDINTTITKGRKSEQWVYSDNYLYFTNGILTAKQ